jgi:hypothetical protein
MTDLDFISSASDSEMEIYSGFKSGRFKLSLTGSCANGIDEADKWEYWCYNGRLFLRSDEKGIEELDKKLIPVIFFNPLFKREAICPYSKVFDQWRLFQEMGKFKFKTLYFGSGPPKFMYELKDDHVIEYVREENGIIEYKLDEFWMFNSFSDYPPNLEEEKFRTNIISKEEFMKLGGLKIDKKPSSGRKTPTKGRRRRKKSF